MYPLVVKCLAADDSAWGELWMIFDHVAARPVRRILSRAGFEATESDDVAIEVFMWICERNCGRLRSFRGETKAELANWLVHIAVNFTRNWIRRRLRAMRRERKAIKHVIISSRMGESEAEILALLEDLKTIAPLNDINRLRMFAGLNPTQDSQDVSSKTSIDEIPSRTQRRWKKKLEEKLRTGHWRGRRRKPKHPPPGSRGRERKMKNS